MRFSKKALALLLAVALTVLIPFGAFAAINPNDLLDTTGVITAFGDNYFTVSINGAEHSYFVKDDFNQSNLLSIGDTVKVYFLPEDPDTAIQTTLIAYGSKPPQVQHSHYSVTGPITDATMNTITVLYKGQYRTFGKGDATLIGVKDGILLGDTVKILYNAENPQEAVQIVMVAHGKNHQNVPAQTVTHYSVTGPITDATMNTITVLYKGEYRTFSKEDAKLVGVYDGLSLGDTVKIVYHKESPQAATQITMIKQGHNH